MTPYDEVAAYFASTPLLELTETEINAGNGQFSSVLLDLVDIIGEVHSSLGQAINPGLGNYYLTESPLSDHRYVVDYNALINQGLTVVNGVDLLFNWFQAVTTGGQNVAAVSNAPGVQKWVPILGPPTSIASNNVLFWNFQSGQSGTVRVCGRFFQVSVLTRGVPPTTARIACYLRPI